MGGDGVGDAGVKGPLCVVLDTEDLDRRMCKYIQRGFREQSESIIEYNFTH